MATINARTKLTKTQAKTKVYATFTEWTTRIVAEGKRYDKMIPVTIVNVVAYKTQKGAENADRMAGQMTLGETTLGELKNMQKVTRNKNGIVLWGVTYKGTLNRKA